MRPAHKTPGYLRILSQEEARRREAEERADRDVDLAVGDVLTLIAAAVLVAAIAWYAAGCP